MKTAYSDDAYSVAPTSYEMREHINMELTVSLTKKLREFFRSDRLLAVVFYDTNPDHPKEYHDLSIIMNHYSGYATKRGFPYLGISFECTKVAAIFQKILEDPCLAPLRVGVAETIYHELGHLKAWAHLNPERGRRRKIENSEALAELYALSRLENGERSNGIDAIAATEAISRYVDPEFSARDVADEDSAKFHRYRRIDRFGMTKVRYFTDSTVKREVMVRAVQHFRLLEAVLGKATTYGREKEMLLRRDRVRG